MKIPTIALINKRKKMLLSLAVVVVIAYAIGMTIMYAKKNPSTSSRESQRTNTSSASGSLVKGTPDFKTLLPTGKSIDSLGGWTRVSPPDRNAVFAFKDSINSTSVIVSEQPLPKEFDDNDKNDHIAELAKGYHADRFVTASGNTKVFIGTSAKGPQSIILTKNNLLVLIKSQAVISDDTWIQYVNSLTFQ
jgi:hypothetical protein